MGIEEQIEREMEDLYFNDPKRYDTYGKDKDARLKSAFLNNFYAFFRDPEVKGVNFSYRQLYLKSSHVDVPNGEHYKSTSQNFDLLKHGHSPLYLSQTPRQFMAAIDQTVLDLGINPVKLHDMANRFSQSRFDEERREFTEMQFRVYVELRRKGYSSTDLGG